MCGRVKSKDEAALERAWNLTGRNWQHPFSPRYNVAPSQPLPVVFQGQDGLDAMPMQWGITPFWTTPGKPAAALANARCETVWEKPAFRRNMALHRALVLVDGFYEWKREGSRKQPYYIELRDDPVMMLGALWQPAQDGNPQVCVITTGADEFMAPIHDRMPVIIPLDHAREWILSGDRPAVDALMRPAPSTWIRGWTVSSYVNSARNEGPTCSEPMEQSG